MRMSELTQQEILQGFKVQIIYNVNFTPKTLHKCLKTITVQKFLL